MENNIMTIDQAWKILQMEPTDDESAIKKQYKSLLPQHNPEDDPEGFKNLREAYELAVNPPKEETEQYTGPFPQVPHETAVSGNGKHRPAAQHEAVFIVRENVPSRQRLFNAAIF